MVRPIHGLVLPEVLRANPFVAADTHERCPPAQFGPLSVGLTSTAGPGAPSDGRVFSFPYFLV